MRIAFILDYSFPAPTASSNRIHSIARSLLLKGNTVLIISIRSTLKGVSKVQISDPLIKIISGSNLGIRQNSFFIRNICKITDVLKSFGNIIIENRQQKIDAVFLPVKTSFINTVYFVFFKLLGIKMLQERSEFPEIYKHSLLSRLNYYYYINFFVKLLDGMIVMTKRLEKYFSIAINKRTKITVIPMSVDIDRFSGENDPYEDHKYIAYCGDLSNKKDGTDILIRAFGEFALSYPEYKLYLIGGTSAKNCMEDLLKLCKESGISEKVVFTGKVDISDIPKYLKNASILALARPDSLQAQGGFPTKLGEYLATKNPAVITDVGEIGNYLKDGESAYIAEPGSVKSFADKLKECAGDPVRSKKIGLNGFKVAFENFHYLNQAEKIDGFIKSLL
jgi:glycosyltransferase involved in cell wall biosynthesis